MAPDRTPPAWLRVVAVCSVLTGLVFLQEPGRIVTDTKLDLTVDPVGWLGRALSLWEPLGWFGQVQNQAYGYLFPMGPFFAAGDLAGLPPWVIQRSWTALLVCAAVVGLYLLARRLKIGSPTTALAAGVLYAMSPRFLTTLGPISAETLPMALAPWIVLPLVPGGRAFSIRAAGARSGLAVVACGAVNAVATLAVLPLPLAYLLTRERSRMRLRLLGIWIAAILAACLWWLVPLVLLGSVSPPFLDWIESARVTTLPTSLVETLRGTSHWVAFAADSNGPFWRGGWQLVSNPVAVLDTVLIAGVGLYGLSRADLPERRWLAVTALIGVALVTFGHLGPSAPPWAGLFQSTLDGVLAPFRNVHKFDPLIRVPLALASSHALFILARGIRQLRSPLLPVVSSALGTVILVGAMSPLLLGTLPPKGAFDKVPEYWAEAAEYLHDRGDGSSLVVPASSFGSYYWGQPRDEPFQALSQSPWAVRDAVPLAPAATIRLLDEVERRLGRGEGGPGLASLLQRLGVRHLVVRNDLDYARAGSARPVLVHEALAETAGVQRSASFGPPVGGGSRPGFRIDAGLDLPYPAVEVFDVEGESARVRAVPVSSATVLYGGPESLAALAEAGHGGVGPVVLAPDVPDGWGVTDPPAQTVLTDGYRWREVDFGRVNDNFSGVLTPDEPLHLGNPARDYLPWDLPLAASVRAMRGEVSASSSMSDAGTLGGARPQQQPLAAVDGDLATWWSSSEAAGAVGEWLQVDAGREVIASGARLDLRKDAFGTFPSRLLVTTDHGQTEVRVADPDGTVVLPIIGGRTTKLRVEPLAMSDGGQGLAFVVAELVVPGAKPTRPLVVEAGPTAPDAIVLQADLGRPGCVQVGRRPLCAEGLARPAEEQSRIDRLVTSAPGVWAVSGLASPRPGPALEAKLAEGSEVSVSATSSAVADPRGSARTVLDGDVETGWVAAAGDRAPALTVGLKESRSISGVSITLDPALAASTPTSIRVAGEGGEVRGGLLRDDGTLTFDRPLRSSSFEVAFLGIRPEASFDPYTRRTDLLPVGVSELALLGAEELSTAVGVSAPFVSDCGEGPELVVDGRRVQTTVVTDRVSVERLQPAHWQVCGEKNLVLAEESRVTLEASESWRGMSMVLRAIDGGAPPVGPLASVPTRLALDAASHRTVEVGARTEVTLLSLRENANRGWAATANGVRLEPVIVDGWHQGWLLSAGGPVTVDLDFRPQRAYVFGLAFGLLLVVVLCVAALVPSGGQSRGQLEPGAPGRIDRAAHAALIVLIGGVVGVAVAVLASISTGGRGGGDKRSLRRLRPVLAALLFVGAGVAFVFHPWGSGAGYAGELWGPQWLALLAIGLATVPLSPGEVPESLGRTLDEDPAQPGGGKANRQGDRQDGPEVAGERLDS